MEYYQWFRLKGPPFQPASPDTAVYFSPTHLEGLATLESGLSGELSGLTLLTGEAGTGKTTLIYSLLQRDYKRVRIAHIDDPKLSFLEIMRVILAQMNLYSTGTTKLDYLEALDRLLALRGKEERIAIIVDESQVLPDEVLEELRLLSNRGQRYNGSLQLILVGQPELAERLKKPELRQLNQRISSRGVLKPLSTAQAIKYVECRLSAKGGKSSAVFERGALKRLLRRSDGIPRKINMLCHTAMNAAYSAGDKKVSYKLANKVASEYHDSVRINRGSRAWLIPTLIGGGAVAALLLVGFLWSRGRGSQGSSERLARQTAARPVTHETGTGRPSSAARSEPIEEAKPDTVQGMNPAAQDESVEQVKPTEQTKLPVQVKAAGPVEQAKTAQQASAEKSLIPEVAVKAAAVPAPRPELRASLSTPLGAATSPKNDPTTTATDMRMSPAAPGPGSFGAATQKETRMAAIQTPAQRSQITVRYGDTLEKIAIRYMGSKSGLNALLEANPQLNNINQLTVGQVIYLPPGITPKNSRDYTETADPDSGADTSP